MSACQYALLAALSVRGVRCIAVEQLPLVPESRLSSALKRFTSRRLTAHVAVGAHAARMVEEASGLPAGRVRTIHNGVPDVAVEAREPPLRRPVVGCASRLDVIKGLDLLLDVAAARPDMHVLLIGDGPDRGALEDQVTRLGLRDRVVFAGWTEDPRPMIASLDVFVLPSRLEGFPLSIVEAMLAEVPVVATDVGSVAEAVDAETGRLVPVDDPAALAAALAELLDDAALRARLGHAGRRRALERFTSVVMVRSFESLYREVCP
jgi:glycosyltransferase involved in cell wall biosynthesis